jgi:hypothetical protein
MLHCNKGKSLRCQNLIQFFLHTHFFKSQFSIKKMVEMAKVKVVDRCSLFSGSFSTKFALAGFRVVVVGSRSLAQV